ncbi:hypothetical protein psal_cds_1252 [Pandoravirus salinus]|uniref:Uncharacterized protein n=1 Tax=Pandoravirus salinus TaxID=1349410 RepID=S4W1B7_9VIRU|nr:hypothetical protein psal_cds_1252 [Pandoravirus salinus]AGO85586.1 hypothetical protein psal_cds_1252 [Pandoravirus salinus]
MEFGKPWRRSWRRQRSSSLAARLSVRLKRPRERAPAPLPLCLTARRRRDHRAVTRILPPEVLAEVAQCADDGSIGACMLASRNLAAAFAHEAARRRAWLAQPLHRMAAQGDIRGLAWARRRARAQDRPHFCFSRACFHAAAGAGRLATLEWLYADQRRHGALACCSTTYVLCKAVEGNHADVAAWVLDAMGPLCSVSHAVSKAVLHGATDALAVICRHACGEDCIRECSRKDATGVAMLEYLDRRGLLDPCDIASLLQASNPVHLRVPQESAIASIEWLCRSAFGDRCDWSLPDVRRALSAALCESETHDAEWRRLVEAAIPRVHADDLWTDLLFEAATRGAVDVVERAWPLATADACAVGDVAAHGGAADVIDWLVANGHAALWDSGLSWTQEAAIGLRWGLVHRLYVESAASAPRVDDHDLYGTASVIYGFAIEACDVDALLRLRVVCADVLGAEREQRAFGEALSDPCIGARFHSADVEVYLCTHALDKIALPRRLAPDLAFAPDDVFVTLLAAVPQITFCRSLIKSLCRRGREHIAVMMLTARPDVARTILCWPGAPERVCALLRPDWGQADRLRHRALSGASGVRAAVAEAVASGRGACDRLLGAFATKSLGDDIIDAEAGALIAACSPKRLCDAGVDALCNGRLATGRRLLDEAARRGHLPEASRLSTAFWRLEHASGWSRDTTVDQASTYEIAAYISTLRSGSLRDVCAAMEWIGHGDVARGVAVLGDAPPESLNPNKVASALRFGLAAGHLDGFAHMMSRGDAWAAALSRAVPGLADTMAHSARDADRRARRCIVALPE